MRLVTLGADDKVYERSSDLDAATAILDNLLKVMSNEDLFIPETAEDLFQVMDTLVEAARDARKFKYRSHGFLGGKSEDNEYSVKHFVRSVLIAMSVMLALRLREGRSDCDGTSRGAPASDLLQASASSQGVRVEDPSSSAAAPPPRTRRVASALPMRPEEIVAGEEVASIFFDITISRIQQWCPLEESELLEPFKDRTGRWAYDVFGVNPIFLGCLLCLTSGIVDKQKEAAKSLEPREVLKQIRAFYKEAGQTTGFARDTVFAPGPRILWQLVRE